jgi:hypothetical protein
MGFFKSNFLNYERNMMIQNQIFMSFYSLECTLNDKNPKYLEISFFDLTFYAVTDKRYTIGINLKMVISHAILKVE